jgi:hypothetical protein
VLDNAEAIGRSAIDCEIVYAGNRSVAEEVAELLAGKRLRVVDNLLPNFNEPNPDPRVMRSGRSSSTPSSPAKGWIAS